MTAATLGRQARVMRAPVVLLLIWLAPAVIDAGIVKVGEPIRVNQQPMSFARFDAPDPVPLALPDGGFVVVWNRPEGTLWGRRFDPGGEAVGEEFQFEAGGGRTDAAAATDGTLLVQWGHGYSGFSVGRFSSDGRLLGEPITVNAQADVRFIEEPALAAGKDGGFTAVWFSLENEKWIRGQQFGRANEPLAPSFEVAAHFDYTYQPVVAGNAAGAFVVAWWNENGSSIGSRYFPSIGTPGDAFIVTDRLGAFGPDYRPVACVDDDGELTIAWAADFSAFRRYDASGHAKTAVLFGGIFTRSILCLAGGRIVLVTAPSRDGIGAVGRAFNSENRPLGTFIEDAATPTSVGRSAARMTRLSEDSFVLVRDECVPGGQGECQFQGNPLALDVWAQRYHVTNTEECSGDCDGNNRVTIDEIIQLIGMALITREEVTLWGPCEERRACVVGDSDLDCHVTIVDIVTAVGRAIRGCS